MKSNPFTAEFIQEELVQSILMARKYGTDERLAYSSVFSTFEMESDDKMISEANLEADKRWGAVNLPA